MKEENKDIEKIISNLRKIIADKGITQAALARYADVNESQFSKMLNGNGEFRVRHLSNIARSLNMSIIDIITYPEKFVCASQTDDPIKASITIQLSQEKRDRVLQMIFEKDDINFLK